MKSEPAVLIAGAGPTGLTLACGLLANGVAARVVDRAVGPAGTSRALGLQPRGIEVVERLGALNSLPERALQVERIVVHINGKQAATVRVGQRTRLVTRPGLVISQADVEAELRRRVTDLGGEIVWGREVAAAEQDRHGVTVRFADGGHSPFGGQGMNTGIGDAENLAWKLAMVVNGTAEQRLLDSYEAERRPVAADAVKTTGAASNLVLGSHLVARLLRGPGRRPPDEQGVGAAAGLGAPVPAEGDLSGRFVGPPRAEVVLRPGPAARRPGAGHRVPTGRRRRRDHPACRARQPVGAGDARRGGEQRLRRGRGQAAW